VGTEQDAGHPRCPFFFLASALWGDGMSKSNNIRRLGSLTCRESARLLSDGLDRPLSRAERIALRLHLALCRRCRRFARNLAILRDVLSRMTEQCLTGRGLAPSLTLEERTRIRQKLAGTESREI